MNKLKSQNLSFKIIPYLNKLLIHFSHILVLVLICNATMWFTVRETVWIKRHYSLPSTVWTFNGSAIKELVVCTGCLILYSYTNDIIIVSEIHQYNT